MIKNLLLASILIATVTNASAEQAFVNRIPNGNAKTCANCHVNSAGGGSRNNFGTAFSEAGKKWTTNLAMLDSDNDGVSNGAELQDPTGVWKVGNAAPGNFALVTNPSDPNDFPSSVEELLELSNLSISPIPASNFINFTLKTGIIGNLTVSIYDINGLLVNTFNSVNSNGEYNFGWNLLNSNSILVESGFYFAEVKINNYVERRRFIVTRWDLIWIRNHCFLLQY